MPYALCLESFEALEHGIVAGLVPRILEHFLVANDAVLVDDEDRAVGDALQADHVLVEDAVIANRLLVEIAEQRKGETLRIGKRLQREEGIDADAVHLRVRLVEPRHRVAERAQFLLADTAERRREEGEHNRFS